MQSASIGNAIPGLGKLDKLHIPGQGYTDILPKYANATGGDVIDSSSREAIESAYQTITSQARNQYTLGYTTPQRRLQCLSRHRSAREASRPARHREARILPAASTARNARRNSGDHARYHDHTPSASSSTQAKQLRQPNPLAIIFGGSTGFFGGSTGFRPVNRSL